VIPAGIRGLYPSWWGEKRTAVTQGTVCDSSPVTRDDLWEAEEADRDEDAETRANIIRFRSGKGLPADSAVIEHFLAEFKAERQEPGMWLTPSEWRQYEEQQRLQEEAGELVGPYIAQHPETFAGVWLGAGLQPQYNVAFTADLDSHREAMLRLYPRPDVVRVHRAEYTKAELEEIADRISEDVDELAARGIKWMSVGPDDEANRVEVDVVGPDAQAGQAVLRELYGPSVVCSWLGADDTELIEVAWLRWTIDLSGRALTVHYQTMAAYEFAGVTLEEEEQEVRVTVLERAPVGAITALGATREATVQLEKPLGGRRLVDAATGRVRARR
jgi:hypothetical protein